ncbi:MAG: potassium/proton antiporter [Thioalkalivibrionaceae bacterium]
MDSAHSLILIAALVLLGSIYASVVSARLGVPLLLVFLGIGMALGPEGPGGVVIADYSVAYLLGAAALAVILFDGGLQTRADNFRMGLKPSLGLATAGVFVTSGVVGAFAVWWLELSWVEGLLLGAIIGSTDAAAVFSILRARGLALKPRVGATLEIESGSNDPMAIFLTVVLVELLLHPDRAAGAFVLVEFLRQMGLGALLGVVGGFVAVRLLARVPLPQAFQPLAALAAGLSIFALTALLGGSGFLAIYLAGLLIGNSEYSGGQNVKRFHEGFAQLSQIGMFLMLGMLVQPSVLPGVAFDALMVAAVLILIARPVAVALCLLPFRFPWREQVFVGWVGLRGAVPIILALFPLLAGADIAPTLFHLVFFIVLVSLLVQGSTVPLAARWLRLELPPRTDRIQRVELELPGQADWELVGYRIAPDSPVVREAWSSYRLPKSARVVALIRGGQPVEVPDLAALLPDDQLFVLVQPTDLDDIDRLFAPDQRPLRLREETIFGDFVLPGTAPLGAVAMTYGVPVPIERQVETLAEYLRSELVAEPVVGDAVDLGSLRLVIREMQGASITRVGLKFADSEASP